jgi:hypothetical protein
MLPKTRLPDERWVKIAVDPLVVRAWTRSAGRGQLFPHLRELRSGYSNGLDHLVDIFLLRPPEGLRVLSLQDWPISQAKQSIATLFPHLDELRLFFNPVRPKWNFQLEELILVETVKQLPRLRALKTSLPLCLDSVQKIGQLKYLVSLECGFLCIDDAESSEIPCIFPSLQHLDLKVEHLQSATQFLRLLSNTYLVHISCHLEYYERRSTGESVHDPFVDQCFSFIQCLSQQRFRHSLKSVSVSGNRSYSCFMSSAECAVMLRPLSLIPSITGFSFCPGVLRTQLQEKDFMSLWSELPSLQTLTLPAPAYVSLESMRVIFARPGVADLYQHPGLGLIVDENWMEAITPTTPLSMSLKTLIIRPFINIDTRLVARIIVATFPCLHAVTTRSPPPSSSEYREWDLLGTLMRAPFWQRFAEELLDEQTCRTGKGEIRIY